MIIWRILQAISQPFQLPSGFCKLFGVELTLALMYMQVTRGIETDDVTLVYCVPNILTRRHDAKEYKDNCNLRLDYSSHFENNVQV